MILHCKPTQLDSNLIFTFSACMDLPTAISIVLHFPDSVHHKKLTVRFYAKVKIPGSDLVDDSVEKFSLVSSHRTFPLMACTRWLVLIISCSLFLTDTLMQVSTLLLWIDIAYPILTPLSAPCRSLG